MSSSQVSPTGRRVNGANDDVLRTPQDVMADALALAAMGFRVFPLWPGTKIAAVARWYDVATTDPDKIRALFGGELFNIGICCGEGLLVLDIDEKDGVEGHKNLAVLLDFEPTPATLEATTPTGGGHRFYRIPKDLKIANSASKLAPGLDIKAHHGYVVAAGSVTKDGTYRWTNDCPMLDAPDWLLAGAMAAQERPEKSGKPAIDELDDDTAVTLAIDYLLHGAPDAAPGNGNSTTYTVACCVKDFGVSRERCFELMADHYNRRQYRPRSAEELQRTIDNAYQYGGNDVGIMHPKAVFEAVDLGEAHAAQEEARAKAREERAKAEEERVKAHAAREEARAKAEEARAKAEEFRARGDEEQAQAEEEWAKAEEARAKAEEERAKPNTRLMKYAKRAGETWGFIDPPYLIKGMLNQNVLALTYGDSHIGKSFVALDRALHIAMGRTYDQRRIKQSGVIYFALEGGYGNHNRLQAWFDYHRISREEAAKIPFAMVPCSVDLLDPNGDTKEILKLVHHYGQVFGMPVGLVIIDTVSAAIGGGDETKDAGTLLKNARTIHQTAKCTVELIHHTGKDKSRGARGSYKFYGDVDASFCVTEGLVDCGKQRDGKKGKVKFKLEEVVLGKDRDGDPVTSLVAITQGVFDTPDVISPTPAEQSVLNVVLALAEDKAGDDGDPTAEVIGTAEIVAAAKDAGLKMSRPTVTTHLTTLFQKGHLSKSVKGAWSVIGEG